MNDLALLCKHQFSIDACTGTGAASTGTYGIVNFQFTVLVLFQLLFWFFRTEVIYDTFIFVDHPISIVEELSTTIQPENKNRRSQSS